MTRVAHAGVGGWGKNVARVVGELTELAWVVDTDEARQAEYAARYPQARVSGSFADALADDTRRGGHDRDARCRPTTRSQRRRSRRASTSSSRSRPRCAARRWRSSSTSPAPAGSS